MDQLPAHLVATQTPTEVVLQPEQVKQILQALFGSQTFLTRRDQMNAAVHCSEVRWSPLTDQVHDALHMLNKAVVEQYKAGTPSE